MHIGLTPSEIERWVRLDSSNSITRNGDFLYRIAANLPIPIIDLLISRQSINQLYFGAVLRVTKIENQTFYTLGFYTFAVADQNFSEFIIGRTNYELRNFSVDYEPYLNSSNYINLDINFSNLDLSGNIFNQAVKADDLLGYTQVEQKANYIASRTGLFVDDKTFSYYALNNQQVNIFSAIPFDEFTTFNITPSILRLAQGYPFGSVSENSETIFEKAVEKSKSVKKSLKDDSSKKLNPHSL